MELRIWVLFFKRDIYSRIIEEPSQILCHHNGFYNFTNPNTTVLKKFHRGQAIPLARDFLGEKPPFFCFCLRIYNIPERDVGYALFRKFPFNKEIKANYRCTACRSRARLVDMPQLIDYKQLFWFGHNMPETILGIFGE